MTRIVVTLVAAAVLGLATLGAAKLASAQADRPDCPGRIVCPITGEMVCKDRCPLDKSEPTAAQDTPPCCRGGK